MKPTIGRIVHFVRSPKDQHEAAIIVGVEVKEGVEYCDLTVFTPTAGAVDGIRRVLHDEENQSICTWHWPERESS